MTVMCSAPAKVNLCLRITGRRADGYHLLDSIFATIDLYDRLTITGTRAPASDTRIAVSCAYPGVPNDATNLAVRAAQALLAECEVGADVDIAIEKEIPPGAGLGGGSSDAAAVLQSLNTMLGLDVPVRRLADLALALGADIPFFLTGGCARVRGIGERIDPIRGWAGHELILALPPIAVSTAWAFRAYAGGFALEPEEPARLATAIDLDPALLRNDLETAVVPAHPEIARVKEGLLAAGASAAVMSGSGAAVVGFVPPSLSPHAVRETFRRRHRDVPAHCVRILAPRCVRSVDPTRGYA